MKKKFLFVLMFLSAISLFAGERTFLFDFGTIPVPNGIDAQGRYWNQVNSPVMRYIVDTGNELASIGLQFSTDYAAGSNGALQNPNPALLGNLAVPQATSDYFYNSTPDPCTFRLTLLDPESTYSLRFFASRDGSNYRETTYTVKAGNGTFTTNLMTTGLCISHDGKASENDGKTAVISDLKPDSWELEISYGTAQGGFSYISAMELTVTTPDKTL